MSSMNLGLIQPYFDRRSPVCISLSKSLRVNFLRTFEEIQVKGKTMGPATATLLLSWASKSFANFGFCLNREGFSKKILFHKSFSSALWNRKKFVFWWRLFPSFQLFIYSIFENDCQHWLIWILDVNCLILPIFIQDYFEGKTCR